MEENQAELVYWIMRETGGIVPKAQFEVRMVTSILHRAAAMLHRAAGSAAAERRRPALHCTRVPRGVVGVISPFNFPLILSIRAVAPALAAGNAVVLKPDPRTALTGGFIIARLFEEAGLPKGVLQVLPGDAEAGEALVHRSRHRDDLVHRLDRGRPPHRRARRQAPEEGALELGGKNALIVLDDADLDGVAAAMRLGRLAAPGPDLHGHRPRHRAREDRRRADRAAGRQGQAPAGGRPDRRAGGARPADQPRAGRPHPRHRPGHIAAGAKLCAGGTFDGPSTSPPCSRA